MINIAIKAMYLSSHLTIETSNRNIFKIRPIAPATRTDLVKFIKYQPTYILQYYANIKWEIPEAEVYQVLKETKKILMATDGGTKVYKGYL